MMARHFGYGGYALGIAALTALTGCEGDIGGSGAGGPDVQALCAAGDLPGPHPRLVRLTHTSYDNTVRELLGVADLGPSADFIDDPAFAGFDNNAAALTVSERLGRDYRRAAETLSAVAAAPEVLSKLVPCDVAAGDATCARNFIERFGRRAYRRALTQEEIASYVALYGRADGLYATGTPFVQGVTHVIETMLQSPSFLYRVELSEQLDGDKLIPLDGYEIASRLSYFLWNSTPDETLLTAAEAGELATEEGIEAAARRMLDDPRATGPIDDFHAQWLDVGRYENLTKDATAFPDFDSVGMATSMKEETRRFIRHVALEQSGDFEDLLLSRTTFVNEDLAPIYGLPGSFGADFVEVELDPKERSGLLTQVGFLASHAYPNQSSPIHRGVFVQRRVLCAKIPDPPGDIDTTLPPLSDEIKTTKQQVEAHTSPTACVGCHKMINAPGFALETFDAVGHTRTTDNGEPLDPTGTFQLDDAATNVDGPIDLATQLAASDDAKDCYVRQWYRYGFARQETAADECTMTSLGEKFAEGGYNIKEILVAFTRTKTFRFRVEEEVAQ